VDGAGQGSGAKGPKARRVATLETPAEVRLVAAPAALLAVEALEHQAARAEAAACRLVPVVRVAPRARERRGRTRATRRSSGPAESSTICRMR
jgi:hypothetical protein